jgi:LPXTG-motif cell wall-anchored protein
VDLDTGHYFLGGYVGTQQNLVFRLWEYTPGNPGSVTYKGSVATPNENVTGADNDHRANGDMAFDANGNLFIVQGVGTTTTIYSVTSNTLDNASGGDIASSSSKPVPNTSSRINGTAFDFNGQGYLGNATNLDSYDMPGWSNEGTSRDLGTAVSGINASTDLASCSSPSTISIQKNVQDARVNAADQFKLTLNRQGTSNSLAEATTKGNNPGIQPDQIGPLPVRRGTQLTFAEAASGMPNLNNYDSTWACTVDGDQLEDANGNDVKGTGTSGSLTFPTDGQDVTCIFTNTPKPGNATWQKQDSSTKAPLDGSEWTLTGGPNWATVPANTVVSDCTSSPCAAGLYKDQDSAAGKFQLNGLPIGSYTLVEKTAPTGYELNTLPYNFTVTANGTVTVTGSPFLNTKLPVATVTISKTVQDVNGQNGKPATGWSMNTILAAGNPAGVAITPAGAQTTAGSTGVTPPWTVTYPSASSQASATVSETQQTGYQFVSGSCMVTPTTGSVRTVNLTGATENLISGINPGENVACSFVNKQKPGSVSWSKSDTGGDLLDGSEWTLTPTDPAGAAISVTDNTGQSGYSGLDTNTDAGKFTVGALKWGKYELQETKAPAGYVLSGTKYPFEIKATGLTATVNGGDAIKNEQATPPNLPLTGGMSTDAFLIGGSSLIIVSAGVWLALRRRSRAEA